MPLQYKNLNSSHHVVKFTLQNFRRYAVHIVPIKLWTKLA